MCRSTTSAVGHEQYTTRSTGHCELCRRRLGTPPHRASADQGRADTDQLHGEVIPARTDNFPTATSSGSDQSASATASRGDQPGDVDVSPADRRRRGRCLCREGRAVHDRRTAAFSEGQQRAQPHQRLRAPARHHGRARYPDSADPRWLDPEPRRGSPGRRGTRTSPDTSSSRRMCSSARS